MSDDLDELPAPAVWVVTNWRGLLLGAAVGFLGLAIGIFAATPRPPGPDSVDGGFVVDMMYHHDQAVRISLRVAGRSDDTTVNAFAQEVVVEQRWDMGRFAQLIDEWRLPTDESPNRTSMRWMGMAMPATLMHGIQPEDEVTALSSLTGAELNRQFLTMMRDHHKGGIEMANYQAEHGSDKILRNMARVMARNQQAEINEYTAELAKLGLE